MKRVALGAPIQEHQARHSNKGSVRIQSMTEATGATTRTKLLSRRPSEGNRLPPVRLHRSHADRHLNTSHDVEGFRNERLINFFINSGITDPVNFPPLGDDWRKRIKEYVPRLIKLRTSYDALDVNDTEFIHIDFNDGKRVLVWRRGQPGSDKQVVVLANFSDFGTLNPLNPSSEYFVLNWPVTPQGKNWREIPQDRDVSLDSSGTSRFFRGKQRFTHQPETWQ